MLVPFKMEYKISGDSDMEIVIMQTRSSSNRTKPEITHNIKISAPVDSDVVIDGPDMSSKSDEKSRESEKYENSEQKDNKVKTNARCSIVMSVYIDSNEECKSKTVININEQQEQQQQQQQQHQHQQQQINITNIGERPVDNTNSDHTFEIKLKVNSSKSKSLPSITVTSKDESQHDNENLALNNAKNINIIANQNVNNYTLNITQGDMLEGTNTNETDSTLKAKQGTSLQNMSVLSEASQNSYDDIQYVNQSENSASDVIPYALKNNVTNDSVKDNVKSKTKIRCYENFIEDMSDVSLGFEHEENVPIANDQNNLYNLEFENDNRSRLVPDNRKTNDNSEDIEVFVLENINDKIYRPESDEGIFNGEVEEVEAEEGEDEENTSNSEYEKQDTSYSESEKDTYDSELEDTSLIDHDMIFTQLEDISTEEHENAESDYRNELVEESVFLHSFNRHFENEASNDKNMESVAKSLFHTEQGFQGKLNEKYLQIQNSDIDELSDQSDDAPESTEDLNNSIQEIIVDDKENEEISVIENVNTFQKNLSIACRRCKDKNVNSELLNTMAKRKHTKPKINKTEPFHEIQINRWINNIEEVNNFKTKFDITEQALLLGVSEERTDLLEKYNIKTSCENLADDLNSSIDSFLEKDMECNFQDLYENLYSNPNEFGVTDSCLEFTQLNQDTELNDARNPTEETRKRKAEMEMDKNENYDSDCEIIYTSEKIKKRFENDKIKKPPSLKNYEVSSESGIKSSNSNTRNSFKNYVTIINKKYSIDKCTNVKTFNNSEEKDMEFSVEKVVNEGKSSNSNLSSVEGPDLALSLNETNDNKKKTQKRKYNFSTYIEPHASIRGDNSPKSSRAQPDELGMERNISELPGGVLEVLSPEKRKRIKDCQPSKKQQKAQHSQETINEHKPSEDGNIALNVPGPTKFSVVSLDNASKEASPSQKTDLKTEMTKQPEVRRVRYSLLQEYRKRKEKRNLRL